MQSGNREAPTGKLIEGYRQFFATTFSTEKTGYQKRADEGQAPKVMMIACADSRVSLEEIFQTRPGEIFTVRNVGNIVPAYDPDSKPRSIGAAVEYAIKVLQITDIIIMGHARCGGVAALVDEANSLAPMEYLKAWVEVAAPARKLFPANFEQLDFDDKRLASELAVIQNSLINLSGFPWVRELLDTGALHIHGWHFDIHNGKLASLDAESGEWVEVK
jgi:carbonic anhydrase